MPRIAKGAAEHVDMLLADIRDLILLARRAVVRSVDTLQVLTSFEIGRRIVEHEQQGAARAEYGRRSLGELAERLTEEFGRGFSRSNLEYMRKLFLAYRDRLPGKSQMASGKLQSEPRETSQTLSGGSSPGDPSMSREGAQTATLFRVSWSQYVFLLGIDDTDERAFYEIESARNGWTLPELKRQFNASLYERLALSRDKRGIRKLAQHGQIVGRPQDLLKEPYVLEFLAADHRHHPLQEKARRVGHNHSAQERQHPCSGIPTVPAVEGRIAAQTCRVDPGIGGETMKSDAPVGRDTLAPCNPANKYNPDVPFAPLDGVPENRNWR
jgi:hypothetical protein